MPMTISYSINLFCGIKVVKFVGAHGGFNPRMKELNQQLTKSLIVLVWNLIFDNFKLTPLIFKVLFHFLNVLFSLAQFALALTFIISEIEMMATIILFVGFFTAILFAWLPVVNPIVSIWINRPYRDAVSKFIATIFKKNNSVTTVH